MKKLFIAMLALTALASQTQAYERNTLMLGLGVDNLRDSSSDGASGGDTTAGACAPPALCGPSPASCRTPGVLSHATSEPSGCDCTA